MAKNNHCDCLESADCAAFEDGGLCNGALYCDQFLGKCKFNKASKVLCAKAGTACTPNACDPADGKRKPTPRPDGTACDADGTVCTVDACQGGECKISQDLCICLQDIDCVAAARYSCGRWYVA